jgi:hypothetical protein
MIIKQANGKRIYQDALALIGATEEEYAAMAGLSIGSLRNSSARDRYRELLIRVVDRMDSLDKPWAICVHCGYCNRHEELPDTSQPASEDICLNCGNIIGGG